MTQQQLLLYRHYEIEEKNLHIGYLSNYLSIYKLNIKWLLQCDGRQSI
jgi:hypothetical protein